MKGTTMSEMSTREAALNGYIAGVKATAPRGEVFYLSTQITSGERMFQAAQENGYSTMKEFKADPKNAEAVVRVMAKNTEVSNELLHLARDNGARCVVTPTTLDVPGFTQEDYAWFWRSFIEEFKPTVIVSPAWQFSRGSRFEVQDALDNGCSFLDAELNEFPRAEVEKILASTEPLP